MSHVLSEAAAAERRRLKRIQLQEQLRQLDEEKQQSASQSYARSSQAREQYSHQASGSASGWTENDPYNHSRYHSGEPSYPSYSRSNQPDPSAHDGYSNQYSGYDDRSGRDTYQSTSATAVPTSASAVYRSRQEPTPPAPAKSAASSAQHTPVPSREQVNDYLVQHMNYPRGLAMGWNLEGIRFDVYELFSAVVRAGGSSTVTSRDLWPILATDLKIPAASGTNGMRSSTHSANTLRDFFLQNLGGLEILWDQTKGPTNARSGSGADNQQPISQDARRTVLNAQTRQSPTATTFQQSQSRHPVHQAYQQSQSQLAQPGSNRLNSTSTQTQSRPVAPVSNSSSARSHVAPISSSSQVQQQPNTALSYWQNQYYGSSRQQSNEVVNTAQSMAPSSRLQQPYATSERYTSQTVGTQQPTSSYRTTQTQHRSNMPTTVSPADLRLQPTQPLRLPPVHDPPRSAPSSQPPSPHMPFADVPDEDIEAESSSHAQKKKRVRKPKEPQYDENGVLIVTSRKRTPKEPHLDENGQVIPQAKKSKQPQLDENGQVIPRVKKTKPPQLDENGQVIPRVQKTKPPPQLDENGQVIVRPRGRPKNPPQYDENGVLLKPVKKRKSRARPVVDAHTADGTASTTDGNADTRSAGPLLPSTSAAINIPSAAPPSTLLQNDTTIPIAKTFDELVLSGMMPLPRPGPGTSTNPSFGMIRQYAARCQELRVAVKRTRHDEEYRVVTPSEIAFWNKLVVMLKRNPGVVIPGADYFIQHPERAGPVPDETQYNTLFGGGGLPNNTGSQINDHSAKKSGRPRYPRDENGKIIRPPPRLNPDGTPVIRKKQKQAPFDGEIVIGEGGPSSQMLNPDGTPIIRNKKKRPRPTNGEGGDSEVNAGRRKLGRPRRTGNGTDNAFGISSEFDKAPKWPKIPKVKASTPAVGEAPAGVVGEGVASDSGPVDMNDLADGSVDTAQASQNMPPASQLASIPEASLPTDTAATTMALALPSSTPNLVVTSQTAASAIGKTMSAIPTHMLGKFSAKPKKKSGPVPRPVHFISSERPVEALLGALAGYSTPSKTISLSSGPGIEAKLRRADITTFSPKKFSVPSPIVMPVATRMGRPPGTGTGRPRGRPPGRRNAVAGPSRLVPRSLVPAHPAQTAQDDDWQDIESGDSPDIRSEAGPSDGSARRRPTLEAVEITPLPRSQLSRFVASQVETPTRVGPSRSTALTRMTTRGSATPQTPVRRVTRTTVGDITPVAGPSSLPMPSRTRGRAATIDDPPASLPLARTRRGRLSEIKANVDRGVPVSIGLSRRTLRSQRSPSIQLLDSEPRRKRVRLASPSPVRARTPSPRRTRNSLSAPVAQPKKASKPTKSLTTSRGMRYVTRARRPVQRVALARTTSDVRQSLNRPQPVPKLAAGPSRTARPAPRAITVSPTPSFSPTPSPSPEPEYSLEGRGIPVVEIILRRKRKVVKPRVEGMPVSSMRVVLPISRKRRAELISRGFYDTFRDDDSEDDEYEQRKAYSGLRPMKISRMSKAYNARPIQPEPLPLRFLIRAGPGIIEPWKSILDENTLLLRAAEHECGWKGCDAVLGSEDLLKRHVEIRRHAAQGQFRGGPQGQQVLYRCHWYGCEEPCFEQERELLQHMMARHVSRVLACPYEGCDLYSPTVSHLARHVMRNHDGPNDTPRPLANLSARIPPTSPVPDVPLPTVARTDELTTPAIAPSIYRTIARNEWVRAKVHDRCFGGENPVMHVEHPPHMLQHIEDPDIVPANDLPLADVDAEVMEEADFDMDLELAVAQALDEVEVDQEEQVQNGSEEVMFEEQEVDMEEDTDDREFRLAVEELAEEARREKEELAAEVESADVNGTTDLEGLNLDLDLVGSEQAGADQEIDGDTSDFDSSALAGLTADPSPFEQDVNLPVRDDLPTADEDAGDVAVDPQLDVDWDSYVADVDVNTPVQDGKLVSGIAVSAVLEEAKTEAKLSTPSVVTEVTGGTKATNDHESSNINGLPVNNVANGHSYDGPLIDGAAAYDALVPSDTADHADVIGRQGGPEVGLDADGKASETTRIVPDGEPPVPSGTDGNAFTDRLH